MVADKCVVLWIFFVPHFPVPILFILACSLCLYQSKSGLTWEQGSELPFGGDLGLYLHQLDVRESGSPPHKSGRSSVPVPAQVLDKSRGLGEQTAPPTQIAVAG